MQSEIHQVYNKKINKKMMALSKARELESVESTYHALCLLFCRFDNILPQYYIYPPSIWLS